ncbi:bifunctional 23S rRNA (guanine(2069)-N(7))-methyltransferase RlmK/23S rRNA (guanine(2445)-N(2))-methyltransferase RlmL [Endozoicomonas sp. 8E]|uniref:bifunctional 23S rRNA (guanine(2069)-N(7))-methyltransferase RlmK/23S rRNA (guanine(2445)-N(2))-methyltransferase RlmL n=1 Tax=Endozoicomonas sp. 8E TaxID=3035692 RepID=UPI00293940D3|nr:bifunctional 23S rRNA (guanine(2069)-N(7))-methyltransferase RlmK/23S rRNA (guanine(2445)-N(2))-methyltransferase RlmL [Endozoicomonas sp. 8E]WOG26014.1 bifunctional 23S rRNA (guanine(2069)-N(7))-methyltransferase RlmK/23S rRNA (guanine(2445)-N(2))-methyltransferase RlmL [Endozoicomonas sp. 8E]
MNTPLTERSLELFASCPKGLEILLARELADLGAESVQETVAGVSFNGSLEVAYRSCLWSRLASRILLRLGEIRSENKDSLYQGVRTFEWDDHLDNQSSFRVDFNGSTPDINHTRFGAQVVKDAIVDQLRDNHGWRPSVQATNPDLRVNIHARGKTAFVSIDLSGQSLHQRGYRQESGEAPLKENLAAAILIRAGWPEMAAQGKPLMDPMCGAGTLLIEGAMMAADIAPGLLRARFGFDRWMGHVPKVWTKVLEEARERRQQGLANLSSHMTGFEGLGSVAHRAKSNLERAGLSKRVRIRQQELKDLAMDSDVDAGLVVCNPPYGERMGDEASLVYLYKHLGEKLKEHCPGWQAGIFTGTPSLVKNLGMGPKKSYSLFNGALPCKLFLYDIRSREAREAVAEKQERNQPEARTVTYISEGANMFANRLKKNFRQMSKWARKNNIDCYRLYDADMPEYAVAVDVYRDWVHVQEYAAPKSINEEKAQERLIEALAVTPEVLNIPDENIVLKRRERQSGSSQYVRQDEQKQMMEVEEGGCRLLVNLHDYLDTGLFLDHRLMRMRLQKEAAGKRFLNLFCYTATATVHAAMGGAVSSTSVDLSNTYLDWGKKNLALNGLSERRHRMEREDCLKWLEKDTSEYDLIFMDPPTFSNSKKLKDVFDVQKDHFRLIELAVKRLSKGGVLYFSNNFRKFKLDERVESEFLVEEITHQTIDRDFQRRKGIHRSWKIMKKVNGTNI